MENSSTEEKTVKYESRWYKICNVKVVRQNLDPFLESKPAQGMERTARVLLRPPEGKSIIQALQRPWRRPGDDI